MTQRIIFTPPVKKTEGEFTFVWSIHNFSHFSSCGFKDEVYLSSPQFLVPFGTGWFYLHLSNDKASNCLSCYLEFCDKCTITCSYVLSIRMSNGFFKDLYDRLFQGPNKTQCGSRHGYANFLSCHELSDHYLDNDVFTLSFQMKGNIIRGAPVFSKCYACTKIKVSRFEYVWTLKGCTTQSNVLEYQFNKKFLIESPAFNKCQLPNLNICLSNSEKSDTIFFSITPQIDKDIYLVYKIHLMDVSGSAVHSVGGDHLFEQSTRNKTCKFPILSKLRLLSQKKLHLPNDTLTLPCEFSFSSNVTHSEIEKYEQGKLNTDDSKLQPELIPDGHDLWKQGMRKFYTEGKFSDLIVRTSERDIPVHKAILCAQSTVFCSMFKHKMKESISGLVEIEDLETDIVSQMLEFLYTNTLSNLDYSAAQKLYFASDRYGIKALRTICSSYLTRCLDTPNVCDVLALADTHKDVEMKSRARDFVMERSYEIVHSESWKKLMQTHCNVTSELMQEMISKNFLGFFKV